MRICGRTVGHHAAILGVSAKQCALVVAGLDMEAHYLAHAWTYAK